MPDGVIDQVEDGERVASLNSALTWICCDCGLTHEHTYRVEGPYKVIVKVKKMGRITGQVRRWMRVKKQGVFGG